MLSWLGGGSPWPEEPSRSFLGALVWIFHILDVIHCPMCNGLRNFAGRTKTKGTMTMAKAVSNSPGCCGRLAACHGPNDGLENFQEPLLMRGTQGGAGKV